MDSFDFVVVGAGSAGSVLASRLTEDSDVTVALIEAGGPASDPAIADPLAWLRLQGTAIDWQYATVPQPGTAGRVHAWPRGRAIGGSSCLNAMAHVRGHQADFDAWVKEGCAGWGFADLFPYFLRSESSDRAPSPYHGNSGPVRLMTPADPHPVARCFMAAAVELGLKPTDEHNGQRMAGPTLNTLTIVDGRRQTVADAYLTPVLARPNLTVLDRASVTELLTVPGPRCTGVAVERGGKVRAIRAERGVVLAAGTIGSPVILLRSGIGPAADLRKLGIKVRLDLPSVGENLHDHLLSGGNVYRARAPVPVSKYQHSESLLYIERSAGAAPELALACVAAPVTTEAFAAPPFGSAYTIMAGFAHPRSRGTVRLASADSRAQPLIDPNYLAERHDREMFLEALDWARRLGAARALDDWREGELLPGPGCTGAAERLAFLERAAHTHHHPVGTCRMGTGDMAVVGPDLALRGMEGLYVADASVIPRITTGPVNAAVVAIAERASDLLRGRTPLAPCRPAGL